MKRKGYYKGKHIQQYTKQELIEIVIEQDRIIAIMREQYNNNLLTN